MAKNLLLNIETYSQYIQDQFLQYTDWQAHCEELVFSISNYLKARWLEKLHELGAEYKNLEIYFVGSYLREEASLYSDVDLLIDGDKALSESFLEKIHLKGYPLRVRHIAELCLSDLDPFSMMSLVQLAGRSESARKTEKIWDVTKQALVWMKTNEASFIESLNKERSRRWKTYDSISNYLEPNLKFQPGGLRDIEQASFLLSYSLGRKPNVEEQKVLDELLGFRGLLSLIRQVMQRNSSGDILFASMQSEVGEFFQFQSHRAFMSYVQSVLEESFFLCQWAYERHARGPVEISEKPLVHVLECLRDADLQKDSRHLKFIRENIEEQKLTREQLFEKDFMIALNEALWTLKPEVPWFLYQSKLLDLIVPEFAKVRSLVQHDQYHRYTVAAHSIVCVRNSFLMAAGKFPLKRFEKEVSKLDRLDWSILFYTALFHDIGKGRNREHGIVGAELSVHYLKELGQKEVLIEEVSWMVKNHLLFSKAAFRTNMQESSVFDYLDRLNLSERRVRNLSLFTLLDIASSNPEALTTWKEDLLFELFQKLTSQELRSDTLLRQKFRMSLPDNLYSELANIDFDVLGLLSEEDFEDEMKSLTEANFKEDFRLFKTEGPYFVVRYYSKTDTKGLLASLLGQLLSLGFSIFKVSANTLTSSVYDLFQVTSDRPVDWLENLLKRTKVQDFQSNSELDIEDRVFAHKVEGDNYIVRVEGEQLNPLVYSFCDYLSRNGIDIYWLRIHRWGRQNEIIAGVSSEVLTNIKVRKKKLF